MAPSFKSKRQFAGELGLSESTLHRRLKSLNIPTSGKRLSPLEQNLIRLAFGFPPPVMAALYSMESGVQAISDLF